MLRKSENGKKSYKNGVIAELVAAIYLLLKGYRILERRYKTKVGEIDLIAKKGGFIVFCEIKYRPNIDSAFESISQKQQGRILRAAEYYLNSKSEYANYNIRLDAIAISPYKLPHHIKSAWTL